MNDTLAIISSLFGLVGLIGGLAIALAVLILQIVKRVIRARKHQIFVKLPPLSDAWIEGYDASLEDFDQVFGTPVRPQSRNPYTGYTQAGA